MKPLGWKMGLDRKLNSQAAGYLLLVLVVLVLFSFRFVEPSSRHEEPACADPLFVQADGDVRNPGVYSFCSTPTVEDLLKKAGGLRKRGAVLHPQTGRALSSGSRVHFETGEEGCGITQSQMSPFHKLTLGIPLSLNEESEEGLLAVPGIGPRLAKAIVDERTRRGGFRDPEELKEIPGIGPKLYARIRSLLRV